MIEKKKIVIFTSDKIGLDIYNFIKKTKNYKLYLVVSRENKMLIKKIKKSKINIFIYYEDLNKFKNFLNFKEFNFDLLISAYFHKIFSKKIYRSVKKTVNFHPSYLPKHKGCYPHIHSMITGKGCGITFHELDEKIDSGKIWFQKKIIPNLIDNQDSFHDKLKKEIVKEFKKKFLLILNGIIKPKIQSSKGNYNNKKSLNKIDKLYLNKKYRLKDLIIFLNARKYKKEVFSYFKYKNKKYRITIKNYIKF